MALNTIRDIIVQSNEKFSDMVAFKYYEKKDILEKTYSDVKKTAKLSAVYLISLIF